jgi:hypothetical protein
MHILLIYDYIQCGEINKKESFTCNSVLGDKSLQCTHLKQRNKLISAKNAREECLLGSKVTKYILKGGNRSISCSSFFTPGKEPLMLHLWFLTNLNTLQ